MVLMEKAFVQLPVFLIDCSLKGSFKQITIYD